MVELTEEEVLGLKIMSLYNMNMLGGLNCFGCQRKEMTNCEMDDSKVSSVFFSTEFDFELTTCPLNCVPDTIRDFLDEYYHYENWSGSMGSYDDLNARWHTASVLYRSYINKLSMIQMKQSSTPTQGKVSGLEGARKKFMNK